MNEHRTPWIACAVCGFELDPQDVVIVTREVVPAWATSTQQVTTIVHRACEFGEDRADHTYAGTTADARSRHGVTGRHRESAMDRAYAGTAPALIPTAVNDKS